MVYTDNVPCVRFKKIYIWYKQCNVEGKGKLTKIYSAILRPSIEISTALLDCFIRFESTKFL